MGEEPLRAGAPRLRQPARRRHRGHPGAARPAGLLQRGLRRLSGQRPARSRGGPAPSAQAPASPGRRHPRGVDGGDHRAGAGRRRRGFGRLARARLRASARSLSPPEPALHALVQAHGHPRRHVHRALLRAAGAGRRRGHQRPGLELAVPVHHLPRALPGFLQAPPRDHAAGGGRRGPAAGARPLQPGVPRPDDQRGYRFVGALLRPLRGGTGDRGQVPHPAADLHHPAGAVRRLPLPLSDVPAGGGAQPD